MNHQEQEQYLKQYKKAKEKGVPFYPDIVFKDAVVALLIFAVLIALAFFVGVHMEEQANPADASYTPKPEWYFLFLFQALKYFPGKLEVIGAVIIPTLFILLLFALPFFDRSPKRHPRGRPFATFAAVIAVVFIVGLTVMSVIEAPPPVEAVVADPAATLYARNCASCHGQTIELTGGVNLHELIASGGHEGMPAWGGDLSDDEIDMLIGYISSPRGSDIFVRECAECHETGVFAIEKPIELVAVLDQGPDYPAHKDVDDIPNWAEELPLSERNALLNFLAAPDGERLYAVNCAGCHGHGLDFEPVEDLKSELRDYITQGGMHRQMPAFSETLSDEEIDILTDYVMRPDRTPEGQPLFEKYCSICHQTVVPQVEKKRDAKKAILAGGKHETMPVWGEVLTPEQIDALVTYAAELIEGGGVGEGALLYRDNCALCHGPFGEGGPNPTLPGDIIAPISTAEYLRTRDDVTLRNIISFGQPNFGMSPFGSANGGPLENEEIDAIIALFRSWEDNPPVETPPEVDVGLIAFGGEEVFQNICAQCHGANGEGGIGPTLNSTEFRSTHDDDDLRDTIAHGRDGTTMIPWGSVLSRSQIDDVIDYINIWGGPQPGEEVSFEAHIQPLLQRKCGKCHDAHQDSGGWRSDSYQGVMESGDNAPVVIPGDPDNSLMVQKLLNRQRIGKQMPPDRLLNERQIQWVIDWVQAGASDN